MGIPQDPRELAGLGVQAAASTVREILKNAGIESVRNLALSHFRW